MSTCQKNLIIEKNSVEFIQTISSEDFLNLNVEQLIIEHHKKNAENSCFYYNNHKLSNSFMFIISQDKQFIDTLNMLKPNQEKTLDIFQPSQQNSFTTITLKKLYHQMDGNQGDYEIEFDNRSYSFRFIKGVKVKNTLEKIHNHFVDPTNMINDFFKKLKM